MLGAGQYLDPGAGFDHIWTLAGQHLDFGSARPGLIPGVYQYRNPDPGAELSPDPATGLYLDPGLDHSWTGNIFGPWAGLSLDPGTRLYLDPRMGLHLDPGRGYIWTPGLDSWTFSGPGMDYI
jgi:hypothetical protein